MGAENKPKKAGSRGRQPIPDIREIFSLHLTASRYLDDLLEEVRELKAAGKVREARKVFKEAEEIEQQIRALENGCKTPDPHKQVGS